MAERTVTRRTLLVAGAGTVGAGTLAACGDGGGGGGGGGGYGAPPEPTTAGSPASSPESSASSPSSSDREQGGAGGGARLVPVSEVPVGGAVSATAPGDRPLIVAQPKRGEVVAFSAICTHQGCTVAPQDKILTCPCHGSTYDLATGDNTGGPAPRPLARVRVRVVDGEVRLA